MIRDPFPSDTMSSEELREALVDLDRLRRKERDQRLENEVLLCGLHTVVKPRRPRSMFRELVRIFEEVMGFKDAAVFVVKDRRLRLWAATRRRCFRGQWNLNPTFERALQGHVIASFDISRLEGGPPYDPSAPVCSALIFAIRTERMKALVLCTHPHRGFFNSAHQRLVRRFTPLATQALVNVERYEAHVLRERLSRERQVAEERIAFLERAVEDLGVGVCTVVGGRLGWRSRTLDRVLIGFESAESWWDMVLETISVDELCGRLHSDDLRASLGYEVHLQDDHGFERSFRLTCSQVEDRADAGPLLLVSEFTRIVLAERALLQSRQQKAAILDTSSDGVVTLDPQGNVLSLNRAAEHIFGYGEEAAIGLNLRDLVTWPGAEHDGVLLDRWAETEERLELEARRPDGAVATVELSLTRLDDAGDLIYAAFFRDVTERKEAERQLRAAKSAAEDANTAKTQFLATMSHELRTPLNVIAGMLDLLSDRVTGNEELDWLDTAMSSVDMLAHLISGLLDMTRIESGGLELKAAAADPRRLIEDLGRVLTPKAEQKGLELMISVCPRVASSLLLDGPRLRQILANLVDNGIKFTDRGTVALRTWVIGEGTDSQTLRFCVEDTGIGIPENRRHAVFEPFFQVDSSSRRRHGGVGLGLAISQTLAQLMGGKIRVEARDGDGTRFVLDLTLPKVTVEETGPEPVHGWTDDDDEAKDVLLVEDHPGNRLLAERFLSFAGHRVEAVADGPAALEAFAHRRFHIVFLDIEMPYMDGLEVARRMRNQEALFGRPRTPIVALTAHALESYHRRSQEAGMDAFLVKPIRRKDLGRAVFQLALSELEESPTAPQPDAETADGAPVVRVARDIADLIPIFFEHRRFEIEQLEACREVADLDTVQRIGHGLKGCGISYGFNEVSRLGAALETRAKAGELERVAGLVEELRAYLDRVVVKYDDNDEILVLSAVPSLEQTEHQRA